MENPPRRSPARRVRRVSTDFPVTVTCGDKKFECRAYEISEGGMLLRPPLKELLKEEIQIDFIPPSAAYSLSLPATVMYTHNRGMGVRFRKLFRSQEDAVRNYVRSRGLWL